MSAFLPARQHFSKKFFELFSKRTCRAALRAFADQSAQATTLFNPLTTQNKNLVPNSEACQCSTESKLFAMGAAKKLQPALACSAKGQEQSRATWVKASPHLRFLRWRTTDCAICC